ncbi:MAG: hypothetical protein WBA76_16130 [Phormidesmis sp.]
MSLSNGFESVARRLARPLTALCKQQGLDPILVFERATLWLGWTGLTWLAFLVSLLFIEVGGRNDLSGIDGLLGGALIGSAQWLVLRGHVQRAYRWIVVSVLIWGALAFVDVGAIGWMAPDIPFDANGLFLRSRLGLFYGGYVGLILGLGQWWVMHRQMVQAWRWIPLTVGIWAVAIALGWLVGGAVRAASHLFVGEVVGLMVAWGAIAPLSGIGIVGIIYSARRVS